MNRARLASLLASLALVGSLLAVPLATPAFASLTCPAAADDWGPNLNNPTLLIVYEGTGFTLDTDDHRAMCLHVGTSTVGIYNLKDVVYYGPVDNVCDGQLITSFGTWNDCISAIRFSGGCHYSVSFYLDSGFQTFALGYTSSGTNSDLQFGIDEHISSLKVTYSPVCQTAPNP